jgi:seryl-tRNA synthetase
MLDPQVLRNDIEQVAKALAKRDYTLDVSTIEALEEKRKAIQVKTQELQQQRNSRSTKKSVVGVSPGFLILRLRIMLI